MSDPKHFIFDLGGKVKIAATGQNGTVQARTHYNRAMPNNYLVEYVDGKGDLAESWLLEDQLATP